MKEYYIRLYGTQWFLRVPRWFYNRFGSPGLVVLMHNEKVGRDEEAI